MELYLDSADLAEVEGAAALGFLSGVTTTPSFMHRHGIDDVDGTLLHLAELVPVVHVEAMGDTAGEICDEARRLVDVGLDPAHTVFKVPVSLAAVQACNRLAAEGMRVNVHLVYTLPQAYMAMEAGAEYVCPLVGRLQDQGHDALELVARCVAAVERYGYDARVMFSSVRSVEHVRNAIILGAHAVTVPYHILTRLTENTFTAVGMDQFRVHARLISKTVGEVISSVNPLVEEATPIPEAIVKMTEFGFGCVTVVGPRGEVRGVFTDGDLRRLLEREGRDAMRLSLSDLEYREPLTIEASARLQEASGMFREHKVDNLLVVENGRPVGMLDIQDL